MQHLEGFTAEISGVRVEQAGGPGSQIEDGFLWCGPNDLRNQRRGDDAVLSLSADVQRLSDELERVPLLDGHSIPS